MPARRSWAWRPWRDGGTRRRESAGRAPDATAVPQDPLAAVQKPRQHFGIRLQYAEAALLIAVVRACPPIVETLSDEGLGKAGVLVSAEGAWAAHEWASKTCRGGWVPVHMLREK